ncbi:hypothetical protein FXO38_13947 [Capsicum annuum]|nr:hypothetical protein FXO38_13947 [Capsicum annuum]
MTQQSLGQRDDTLALLKSNLQFAQARMKRYADKGRKDVAFQGIPLEDANWEDSHFLRQRFPDLNLEDKEIRVGLELSDYGMQQRLIPYMHFIGELYNYELIDSSVLFREYKDHNFEPVPFASCNLKYFVSALDGEVPSEIIPMWTLTRLMHMFSSSKLAAPDSGGDQDELELNDYEMRQRQIAHMCFLEDLFNYELVDFAVAPFEKIHGLCPCMLSPTKIIVGLGLLLRIDILVALGATVDCRILLTSKATTIARAILAPLRSYVQALKTDSGRNIRLMVICSLLNLQAIDNAGHDRASVYKVKELEVVDCAIEKLARLLWA